MKSTKVTVQHRRGLHTRTASQLVLRLRAFRSRVSIRKGPLLVDAKSILGLLMLGAVVNTQLEVQVDGEDEDVTIQAVETFFDSGDGLAETRTAELLPTQVPGAHS